MTSGAGLGWLAGLGALAGRSVHAEVPREIEVVAERFRFTPREIPLVLGETVVIALRSLDFEHGFSVPDLGLRADLVPGRVVRLELQPRRAGVLDFLCDNFCGNDHEDMQGRFLVAAKGAAPVARRGPVDAARPAACTSCDDGRDRG